MGPGHVFHYLPGEPHQIEALSPALEYCWLTLDGPLAAQIVTSFGWSRQPFRGGECPHDLFDKLSKDIEDISPAGQQAASASAFHILSLVRGNQGPADSGGRDSLVSRAMQLMQDRFSDPGLNVSMLADHLDVHRATLSLLFRRETGLTCIAYLISLRVQHALSLLRNTTHGIGEIAFQSGFSDADYFCKAVVRATGYNPSEFRKL